MADKISGFRVHLSPPDREKFGIISARAEDISEENLAEVFDFCRREKVEFLIARCRADEFRAAQALARKGGVLADTLVVYLRNLVRTPIPEVSGRCAVRKIREGEEEKVRTVAEEAFRDYGGHYLADERLPGAESGEIYSSWAGRFLRDRSKSREVIVAEKNGEIIGFNLVRMNGPEEGEGILEGVSPRAGRRSLVQRDMAIGAMNWARKRNAIRMLASIALTNIVMQKIIIRLGFEPYRSYHTFHLWF